MYPLLQKGGGLVLKSIRAKIMLAILTVTMFTAGSLTVVFYLRAAEMIEENYSGILYGRMQQTVKNLDESLKEIYYVNMKTAWDEDVRNNAEEYKQPGKYSRASPGIQPGI